MTNLYYQTLYGIVRRIVDLQRYLKTDLKLREIDIEDRHEIECELKQKQEELLQTVKELLYYEKPENLEEWPVIQKNYEEMPF